MENKDNVQAPAPRRSARIPRVQQQAAARAAAQAEAEAEAARQPKRRRTNASTKAASVTAARTATKRATPGPSRRRGKQQLVNEPTAQRQLAPRPEHRPENSAKQPRIQSAGEAVRQPEYKPPALQQQQVLDQYGARFQQKVQYSQETHYQHQVLQQQQPGYQRETEYGYQPGYQHQHQGQYQHQLEYQHQPGYQYQFGHQHQPEYRYEPTYLPPIQLGNPPANETTIPAAAPVHGTMYSPRFPTNSLQSYTLFPDGRRHDQHPQLALPTGHATHQTAQQPTQQQPLPPLNQLAPPAGDALYYAPQQIGPQLPPLQLPSQPPNQPVLPPPGHATHQNAQQPVQQPVAQPANQAPPQPAATQAAEDLVGQPTGQAERRLPDEGNVRTYVRVPKRKRFPIYQWSRSMSWPVEFMGERGSENGGEQAPMYSLDEIKGLAKRTVSGFTGPRWSNYNMSSGWNKLTPEELVEVPTGCPIDRWTRDALYDGRALVYLDKWHCCFDDGLPGPTNVEKNFCLRLLENECPTPSRTMFDPGDFEHICERAETMNEVEILHLLGDLIVPQAEIAVHRGQVTWTEDLKDKLCEPWIRSVPFDEQSTRLPQRFVRNMESTGYLLPMPQPDRTVGFSQHAFNPKQQRRLMAQVCHDDEYDTPEPVSFFKGPHDMFFPFLTTEVKRKLSFKTAEPENAHNMAVAMRGIVTLFKRVHPEKAEELHRKVLGFSVSHNSERVKIHAHYPIIEGENTTYHRWCVRDFKWTSETDKWQAYKFVMAVYNDWAPRHLQRLHSAIDDLPYEYQINKTPSPKATDNNGQTVMAMLDPDVPDVDVNALKDLVQAVKEHRERESLRYTPESSEAPRG